MSIFNTCPMPNSTKVYLSIHEAADYLNVSRKTLRRWEKTKVLIPLRTSGGHRRYTKDQLDKFKKIKGRKRITSKVKTKVFENKTSQAVQLPTLSNTNKTQERTSEDSNINLLDTNINNSPKDEYIDYNDNHEHTIKYHKDHIPIIETETPSQITTENLILPQNNIQTNSKPKNNASKLRSVSYFFVFLLLFGGFVYSVKALPGVDLNISKGIKSSMAGSSNSGNIQSAFERVLAATSFNLSLLRVNVNSIFEEDIAINGENITTSSDTINLFNENATTISFGGEAEAINIGAPTGTTVINNALNVGLDLAVNGNLSVVGIATLNTLTLGADTITDITGDGLIVVDGALTSTFGSSIDSTDITDGTISSVDLNISNSPSDGLILAYDESTGGFTWVVDQTGAGGSLFTDAGTVTYLTDTTDDLVIGGTVALSSSKVSIDGDSDQIQFLVQGNSTQTTNLAVFEQSDGTDVLTIDNSGNLITAGSISAATNETINGIDISAGTISDVVNLLINAGGDLSIGGIGLSDTGANNLTSGASLIGVFDEFTNSNSTTLQAVLNDLDAAIGSGSSKWTQDVGFIYLTNSTDSITIGGNTELGKLAIAGDADELQFVVRGNATQTANLATFENSSGDDLLAVTSMGDLLSGFTQLDGSSTANGAGAASKTLVLQAGGGANFDIGNYVRIDSTNCDGAADTCYSKIRGKSGDTLTLSNSLTWANGSVVLEYHIPEVGGTNLADTLDNRYGLGYFISGVTTGNASTFYGDGEITTSSVTNLNSKSLSIRTGNSVVSGNSGDIIIDTGSAEGTAGTISIGENNTSGITIGHSGINTTISGNLIFNSQTINNFTGNGLTTSSDALTIQLTNAADELSSTTSSGSGLEVLSSGLTLLQGCDNGQVLKWNESNNSWECANDTGASSAVINVENNDVEVGTDVDTLDFSTDFILTASPSNEVNISIADDVINFTEISDSLTLDANTNVALGALTFSTSGTGSLDFNSTGQVSFAGNVDAENGLDVTGSSLTVGGTAFVVGTDGTISAGTWSGTAIAAQYGGTGIDTSGATGVPYVSSGIWNTESTLSLSRGGTGASLTDPNADRILFWDDSANSTAFLTVGSGLSLSDTTLSAVDTSATNELQNLFSTISVSGQSNVVADSITDTLTLAAGSNISITTDASNDIITIAASDSDTNNFTTSIAFTGTSTKTLTLTRNGLADLTANFTDIGFDNPMTTAGDIIYGGVSGTATRLAGSANDGYVLKFDANTNAPFWAELIDNDTNYWELSEGILSPDTSQNAEGIAATSSATTVATFTSTGSNDSFWAGSVGNYLTISSTGGLTVPGATNLNGSFSLGDGGDTGSINTSTWDISSTGAITGATYEGLTITTTTGTLTIASGKTLTANNSLTLVGNDSDTWTFPSASGASGTVVGTDESQTLTNKTLTSPRIGTSILDTNENPLFSLSATGSAVNYLTYANAATGNNPTWTATGSDTNISLTTLLKGTGAVLFGSTIANSDTISIKPQTSTTTNPFSGTITSEDLTADRTWTFQDADGTLAFLSDIPTSDNYQYWTLSDGSNTAQINSTETFQINTGTGITALVAEGSPNTLTLSVTDDSDTNELQNLFSTIAVSGQNNVVADSITDTLTLAAGSNISITTDDTNDIITIAATDTNTTYSAGNDLDLSGTQFNIESELNFVTSINPTNSALSLASNGSGNDINLTSANAIAFDDATLTTAITLTDTDTAFDSGHTAIVDAINAAYNAATGGGAGLWEVNSGVLNPSSLTQDLAIGGTDNTAALFFDTSTSALTLNPFGTSTGNTGELRLTELAAEGTNYTGFKSPDSLDANLMYTLPSSAGSNNYVLTTDGSGGLSWQAVGDVGAGSGDVTAVGDCSGNDCFTQSGTGNTLYFEGATANDFEIALTTTGDPDQDYTITLPNASGEITVLGQSIDLTSEVTGVLPLASGGTGASLTDPNADGILFWDDSANSTAFLTVGSGLSLSDTTLSAVDTSATNELQNLFSTISVSGQSNVVADSITDTLTLAAGSNISITTDASNDIITIAASDSDTTYTFTNGLTESGGTAKLGGTLTENTTLTTDTFAFIVDSLNFDGTTIGLTSDTDLLSLSSGALTVNGTGTFTGDLTASADLIVSGRGSFSHGNNQGLNIPTVAGTPSAVTGTSEGDIVYDSTGDALYIYDGSQFSQIGGGGYSGWTLTGDTGSQVISSGDTVSVIGGTNLTSVVTATDTLTLNLDDNITLAGTTGITLTGTGSGITFENSSIITNPSASVFAFGDSTNTLSLNLAAESAGSIDFTTNDTVNLTLNPGGNVGIGTTDPSEMLHVAGDVLFEQNLAINDASIHDNYVINMKVGNTTSGSGHRGINMSGENISKNVTGLFLSVNNTSANTTGVNTFVIGTDAASLYGASNILITNYAAYGVNNSITAKDDATQQRLYGTRTELTTYTNDVGYGLFVKPSIFATGGTQYGAYFDFTSSNTTNYGVYQTGEATNYFAGTVGIGDDAPDFALQIGEVAAGVDTANGVGIAGDLQVDDFALINALRVGSTATDPGDGNAYIEGNLTVNGRGIFTHGNNQGLNIPTVAGTPSAVTGTSEGDIVYDSTGDALYIYDGSQFSQIGGGGYSGWTLDGDTGTPESINSSDTVTFAGGNGLASVVSSTDTLTFNLAALTSDWDQTGANDIILNHADSELKILESTGGTYYATIDAGDLDQDATLRIDSGINLDGNGNTLTLSGNLNVESISAINQDLTTDATGVAFGDLTLAGSAEGTDALTITAGDLTLEDGDLVLSSGQFTLNSDDTDVTTDELKAFNLTSSVTFDTTSASLINYGAYISNTSSISSGANTLTNIGLYATASGADNNYAAIFENGNVGIGTTSPTEKLHVSGDALLSGQLALHGASVNDDYAINIGNLSTNQRGINISAGSPTSPVYGVYFDISNPGSTGASYAYYANATNPGDFAGLMTNVTGGRSHGVVNNLTVTSDYGYGVRNTITSSSTGFNSIYGVRSDLTSAGTDSLGINNAYGNFNIIKGTNDEFAQKLFGSYTELTTHANDLGYGMMVTNAAASTGGTTYGVYLNLTDTDVTRYGIYEAGGATNYFEGSIGVGTNNPGAKLDVQGGLRLGADTGANNILNTTAAAGAASGDLYWGDKLLCDSSESNCGWTTSSSGSNYWTADSGVLSPNGTDGEVIAATSSATTVATFTSEGSNDALKAGSTDNYFTVGNGGHARLVDGSVSTPGLGFVNDPDTGIYRSASDTLDFTAGGVRGLSINTIASGVNYLSLTPSATGNSVDLGVAGSDANIGLDIASKGTGSISFTSGNITGTGSSSSFVFNANALTSGYGIDLTSTSTGLTTGRLLNLSWEPGSATTATGDLFRLNIGANGNIGNLFHITDNGSTLFRVSESQIESALPHAFTATGDVSVAYDLVFTNQSSGEIQSYGPLTIASGERFENNNLTLRTYGTGDLVADLGASGEFIPGTDDAHNLGNSTNRWKEVFSALGTINTSDARLKTDVVEMDYGLETLMQLRPVSYTLKGNEESGTQLGLIAQEVLGIIPEVVRVPEDINNGYYGIRYSSLIPVLINSIQEQQEIITNQKSQLTTLQSDLASISTKVGNIELNSTGEIASIAADLIATNEIKARNGNLEIDLAESNAEGKLVITGQNEKTVAEIDSEGNARFDGKIKAEEINTQNLETENATVSGELRAKKIIADEIIGFESNSITRSEIEAMLAEYEQDQSLLNEASEWELGTTEGVASLTELMTENLYVTQTAALDSLSVSNSAVIGGDIIISPSNIEAGLGNSINTLTSPLELQSAASQPLKIMAGLVTIDTNGNVTISGDLAVAGKVTTSGINLVQDDTQEATESATVLSVTDKEGSEVATVTATGSATFKELSADRFAVKQDEEATSTENSAGTTFTNNASAGSAIIPAGSKQVIIKNNIVKENSLIFVTPTSPTPNTIYIKDQVEGAFMVGFDTGTQDEVKFNWWVVDVQ